ncbi:hypothetical protein [Methylorubrum extorquens]|uniref:hypothetical protein n=1 Tax=Methylorubrum extorquens TaxID=408 RepID=UPI002237D248|nr:hypothetical protein [Methylorubrum extorquens]UYW30166.1 hypothetical protein OKB92_14130 [Methylorubrum extorquens]
MIGSFPRKDDYYNRAIENAEQRTVFILWRGNQHLGAFMFEAVPPFDFVSSKSPEIAINDEAIILPESLIYEYFRDDAPFDEFIARLKLAKGSRPILVGTPPPKKDEQFLRSIMSTEAYWKKDASIRMVNIMDAKITHPATRLKLWIVVQGLLEQAARRHDIEFCPVPIEVQTCEGYLREQYYGMDATHAWGGYGQIMRDHLHAKYMSQQG